MSKRHEADSPFNFDADLDADLPPEPPDPTDEPEAPEAPVEAAPADSDSSPAAEAAEEEAVAAAGPPPPLVPSAPGEEPPPRKEVTTLRTAAGTYQILKRLGEGGMGEVFHAKRIGAASIELEVAIKRVRTNTKRDDEFRRMFLDEARIAARLRHRNIAQVYDVVEFEEGFLLVMEYVTGQSLRDVIVTSMRKGRFLSPPFALYVAAEVADALHYAHALDDNGRALGIVHRDVTPHNVMLSDGGDVKLLDFGIAISNLEGRERTGTGILKGKASYMSPEQALGEPLDGRSDQFALGIVLLEMLTSRRVFEVKSNDTATIMKIANASPRDVDQAVSQLAPPLREILKRALAKDRNERFATCAEFAFALRDYMSSVREVYGAHQAAAELRSLGGAPDAPRAQQAPSAPSPVGSDAPAEGTKAQRGSRGSKSVPRASPTALTPPAEEPASPPPAGPVSEIRSRSYEPPSETTMRKREQLAERLRNPSGATRKMVVAPLLGLVGMAIAGVVVVRLISSGASVDPVVEVVKTPSQERAEREAEEKQLAAENPPAAVLAPPSDHQPVLLAPPPASRAPSTVAATAPAAERPARRRTASTSRVADPVLADVTPQSEPEPVAPRRQLVRSMVMSGGAQTTTASAGGEAGELGISRGQMIAAKLTTPADPNVPGPVTAVTTADVVVGGRIVIPKGSTVVGSSQSGNGARVAIAWDTITIPGRGAVAFDGVAFGSDRKSGVAVSMHGGADEGTDVQNAALRTAERVVGRVVGDDVAGDIAGGTAGAGGDIARRRMAQGQAEQLLPAPKGTTVFVFVNQSF